MANFAASQFTRGQHIQVNVEGLLDLGDWVGKAAAVHGRIVQIDPVTKMITVVLDRPVGGEHSVTVAVNRVRPTN